MKDSKNKENWNLNIGLITNYLNDNYSVKVIAKSLWIIGEMGLIHPENVEKHVDTILHYFWIMSILNFGKDQLMHWEESVDPTRISLFHILTD